MFAQTAHADEWNYGEPLEDFASFLAQTDNETKNSFGNLLSQIGAMGQDFVANLEPESREKLDQAYAQTKASTFDWLSSINDESRDHLGQMLTQTGYGNYFMQKFVSEDVADEIGDFFAQHDSGESYGDYGLAQVNVKNEKTFKESGRLAQTDSRKMWNWSVKLCCWILGAA